MNILCDDVLLEILTFIHPFSWIPEFQKLMSIREKWLSRSSFNRSTSSYKMYEDVDVNFYFDNMRKTKGSQYKQGILGLLEIKRANTHISRLVEKYYNYDMEAMIRLLDPSIFSTFRTNLVIVLRDIKRLYVAPTNTNEGCLCCHRALPSWYSMFGSQKPSEIKKQVGKREFKRWFLLTKNMIQLGCCSELCYLTLFRTCSLPKDGQFLSCRNCSLCGKFMNVFETFMKNNKDSECECIECQVRYVF